MILYDRNLAIVLGIVGLILLLAGAYVRRADKKLAQSMLFAGSVFAVALANVLMPITGPLSPYADQISERSMGFLMGLMVAFFANVIPKQAGSARRQATLRIAGRWLFLGGLAYSVAWLLVPLTYARPVAILLLVAAMVYAGVRIAWICVGQRSITPPPAS